MRGEEGGRREGGGEGGRRKAGEGRGRGVEEGEEKKEEVSLATKESWKNKQTNEWKSHTEWHRILAFGKLGDFAATLSKGAHIEVAGTLRSRETDARAEGSSKKNPETKNRSVLVRSCRIHSQARSRREVERRRRSDPRCR